MNDVVYFIIVFGLSSVVFGSISAAFLLGWQAQIAMRTAPLLLVGFGLTPWLIAWLLNLILGLLPGLPQSAALIMICLIFGTLALTARKGWQVLFGFMLRAPKKLLSFTLLPFLLFTCVMVYVGYIMLANKPLIDHDILVYGVQGRIFLRDMALRYKPVHYDILTGYYYVALHGFAFPLLFTWEGLLGGLWGDLKDLWMRALTPFYAWLFITLLWSMLREFGMYLAIWVAGLVTMTLAFLYFSTIYHIDPLRNFMFLSSVILFYHVLKNPTLALLVLWGITLGAHALLHSIGMVLAPVMISCFFLFTQNNIQTKFTYSFIATAVFLIAGGFHYVLDVAIGTGWVFKEINWF